MKVYAINYTLNNKPSASYEILADKIRSLSGSYLHCLDSYWLVVHNGGAAAIFDALASVMKQDDRLMVSEIGPDYKAFLPASALDWIQQTMGGQRL